MNISRITSYRALLLAAEAGALNTKASTPEEEARVIELIQQAEDVLKQKITCHRLDQMLLGEHESDNKSAKELFPDIDFECYTDIPSTCKIPGTFGNGWEGDEICARALARYRDAIRDLSYPEAMNLLAHLVNWMQEHHSNTGIGDSEPAYAITDTINLHIFPTKGWDKIHRYEWDDHLQLEPQTG